MSKKLSQTVQYLRSRNKRQPAIGIILGSGLGDVTGNFTDVETIPFAEIPNFPVSSVKGHKGNLLYGRMSNMEVIALQGRFHLYEGYSPDEVVFPVRVMKKLGITLLILSNASGGINPEFEVGDIMVIRDHINLTHANPLTGINDDALGPRFPDMSEPYDKKHIKHLRDLADKTGIRLREGVYAGVTGPNYETPAEYRYLHIIGADAVGMSTVHEVISARHMDLPCLALSVISDLGVPGKIERITHEKVIAEAQKAEPRMARLLKIFVAELSGR